jgi:hypothetical protein
VPRRILICADGVDGAVGRAAAALLRGGDADVVPVARGPVGAVLEQAQAHGASVIVVESGGRASPPPAPPGDLAGAMVQRSRVPTEGAACIVVGHRKSATPLDSTAYSLVEHADRPVLVVPATA